MDKLYTVSETAQLLHISRGNLYRLITEGKLIPIKLGKRTLFSEQELEAFIEGLKEGSPLRKCLSVCASSTDFA